MRTALLLVLSAGWCALVAQPPHQQALEQAMRRAGLALRPFTDQASRSFDVQFRLFSPQTPLARFNGQLIRTAVHNAPPPRQRSAEISRDHLLVVVLDAQQTVRYWQIVVNPCLIRGEFPDAGGNLRKTEVFRPSADLSISIPDAIDAAEVRILQPAWPAGKLELTPLLSVPLSLRGRP
jgi:hypothetical protein